MLSRLASCFSARRFHVALALLLAALLARAPGLHGDADEYVLMTIALASHGTPEVRPRDLATARRLMPQLAGQLDALEAGIRRELAVPRAGFHRGRGGDVHAIHFFAYSALAAIPYRILEAAGGPPLKCFQVVNLSLVFVLGACLLRLFGSGGQAMFGVLLFMASGGALYWNWSSPECLSAVAVLAGLLLFLTGAPIAGCLLAGLAAMQNPAIGAFFGFAPALRVWTRHAGGSSLRASMRATLTWRTGLGIALGLLLFATPIAFNLWQFGVPSIIVKVGGASPGLASPGRLHSYFLDLNQGMVVGIPAVLAALAFWSWRAQPVGLRWPAAVVIGLCAAMAATLALPALAVYNWNSDAAGVMRYAFWGGMPLLFAFLWCLRQGGRWPLATLAVIAAVQAGAMFHATRYDYLHFSPLARAVMRRVPAWYHPQPEVFAERSAHDEQPLDPARTYVHARGGAALKTLFHEGAADLDARLCGAGAALASTNRTASAGNGWRYIDGAVQCTAVSAGAAAVPPGRGANQ